MTDHLEGNHLDDRIDLRPPYRLRTRAFLALGAAVTFTAAQFGGFDCSGLPLLSASTGAIVSAAAVFGVASLASRRWMTGIVSCLVAALVAPIFMLSHMCG